MNDQVLTVEAMRRAAKILDENDVPQPFAAVSEGQYLHLVQSIPEPVTLESLFPWIKK